MVLGPDDLVLPHFAMIDVEPGMTFASRSFEDRCAAAAAGGFAGIGIAHSLYFAERAAGRDDADLRAMAEGAGVVVSEIESIGMPGLASRPALQQQLDSVLHVADVFGASRFFVVAADGVPFDELVETFRFVCDQCGLHGVQVGVEFMNIAGVSGVQDLPTAMRLLELADRPNGGLCLDTYHFFNGPNEWSDLEALDGAQLVMVQLSDGRIPREGADYLDDTLNHRLPPGEGDFNLKGLIGVMRDAGATCPYSVEVLNEELRTQSPVDVGRRLGAAARTTIGGARS